MSEIDSFTQSPEPLVSREQFTPMPDPVAEAPAETFSSEASGIRAAADELQARREERPPPVERTYVNTDGSHAGERRPANETVTAKRAAADLADLRRAEADAQEVLAF
jgi:hypothetical protein